MLKKTITYEDFNGVERTEDLYFNLTEAEIVEMELGTTGGFVEKINKVIAAKDAPTIMNIFKDLLLKSYGEKSPDGKRFIKNAELREAFAQTNAYSKLFMELAFDEEAASNFINNVIPKNMKVDDAKLEEIKNTMSI